MSAKHFINDPESLVLDGLEALTLVNPQVILDKASKAIIQVNHDPSSQVALVAGGGAGHEPAHAAYVGQGLLTAAVSGFIFASPSVAQILRSIVRVGGEAGTILIVKNYTGDIFHFNLAAEKARAIHGLKVEVIVVGDDVSVGRKKGGKVGRRGLAGTVLVHKVLGAVSQSSGRSFEEILEIGKSVAENLVTVGVSLGHVHVPGRPVHDQILREDQVEIGMGIHNEPGCQILRPRPDLDSILEIMLNQLLDMADEDRAFVNFARAEKVVLLVNNLGGLSVLELSAITKRVYDRLGQRGIEPDRVFSGTFMTSLDGPGFSITILKATADILSYIDAPTAAPGWPSAVASKLWQDQRKVIVTDDVSLTEKKPISRSHAKLDVDAFSMAVSRACNNLISAEPQITYFDTIVGDGDCGTTLSRGAKAVLDFLSSSAISSDAVDTLVNLADVLENNTDGTSGALYSLFFNSLATSLRDIFPTSSDNQKVLELQSWGLAAKMALGTLQKATPARVGDRTLMDALVPFVETLSRGSQDTLTQAVQAARKGSESTKGMPAAFGRAVYVEEGGWKEVPDPGAEAVVYLVRGLLDVN